jgi:hypothetical protein
LASIWLETITAKPIGSIALMSIYFLPIWVISKALMNGCQTFCGCSEGERERDAVGEEGKAVEGNKKGTSTLCRSLE